jgi:mRNA interferase RelE/StbE
LFEVEFSNKSGKFIKKSDSKMKKKLAELFMVLRENPVPIKNYDVRKIADSKNYFRIRLGKFRVQYSVDWEEKIVKVLDVDKRSESTYK